MQMQLSSDVQIPDSLLAANALLSEKTRLGFRSDDSTLRWGSRVVISSTAIGISGTLYDSRIESRYTGKERDSESGNDYFGARYYASNMGRFMSPDFSEKLDPVPYAKLSDPQTLNLYSYVLNHPLNSIDPNGHNWFNIDNKWQYHDGDSYTYKGADGKDVTAKSNYTGLLVATATGTNKQGATTYSLTLYDQNKVVGTGTGFSGGSVTLSNGQLFQKAPIADGNYTIRADIHNPAANSIDPSTGQPPVAYGIQPIPNPPGGIGGLDVYGAYGPMRAYMRPDSPGGTTGAYFHGQFDGYGYTHGCLTYGTDTRMINYMYNNMSGHIGAAVDTPVQKP
jgi:RHS repeat-associated protein